MLWEWKVIEDTERYDQSYQQYDKQMNEKPHVYSSARSYIQYDERFPKPEYTTVFMYLQTWHK